MTKRADQRIFINAPANSTALVQAFLTKHYITKACHPSTAQIWLAATSGVSQI
jgi:hypothetical protein